MRVPWPRVSSEQVLPPPLHPTRKLTLYARGGCLACSRPAPGHFNLAAALARRSKWVIFFALKL